MADMLVGLLIVAGGWVLVGLVSLAVHGWALWGMWQTARRCRRWRVEELEAVERVFRSEY